MSKTPTPKHTDRYKARVPNFGKILESEYPPVKSKTPTQNDWEKQLDQLLADLHSNIASIYKTRFIPEVIKKRLTSGHISKEIFSLVRKELADARREVIDSIHDKFCEFAIQGGDDEQAQKGILLYARTLQYLATLRKEGK